MNKDIWFHSFEFPDEEVINGLVSIASQEKTLLAITDLGIDFKEKSVLDIGCFDGYYASRAAQLGAKFVTGIDIGPWNKQTWKVHCEYAVRKFGLKNVYFLKKDFFDWEYPKDIVLFMGVLYHLKHPMLALEKLRQITKEKLVLETHVDCLELDYPAMRYYPNNELNNDFTNWWGPNTLCVKEIMQTCGFKNIQQKQIFKNRFVFIGE